MKISRIWMQLKIQLIVLQEKGNETVISSSSWWVSRKGMTSNCIHCMARYSKGKSERSVWFLPGPLFCHTDCLHGNRHKLCIFVHESRRTQNKQVWCEHHIINYSLTPLAWAQMRYIDPRCWKDRAQQGPNKKLPRVNNPSMALTIG